MKSWFRLTTLMLAAAIGLTAAPTKAADATLGREPAAGTLTGAERWALRPTMALTEALMTRKAREIPLSDLPDERRTVRIVYEGYGEAVLVSGVR